MLLFAFTDNVPCPVSKVAPRIIFPFEQRDRPSEGAGELVLYVLIPKSFEKPFACSL